MKRILLFVIILAVTSGCQQVQVRKHSVLLSAQMPELHYGQVLDNIALARANPNSMPFFGLPAQGTSSNTRALSGGYTPILSFITATGSFLGRVVLGSQSIPVSTSTQNQASVQLTPTTDSDRIELLRILFHTAAQRPVPEQAVLESYYHAHSTLYHDYSRGVFVLTGSKKVKQHVPDPCKPCEFITKDASQNEYGIKGPWYNVATCNRDVPKDACFVGSYCDVFVWVNSSGVEPLRELTMSARLDIASIDLNTLQLHVAAKPGAGKHTYSDSEVLDTDVRNSRETHPFPYPSAPYVPSISP